MKKEGVSIVCDGAGRKAYVVDGGGHEQAGRAGAVVGRKMGMVMGWKQERAWLNRVWVERAALFKYNPQATT